MVYNLEELLAAQALLCLHYGSMHNAIEQGAYAPQEEPESPVRMDVEPVAGPSGMCRRSDRNNNDMGRKQQRLSSDDTEDRTELLLNGGVPIGSGKTIVPADKYMKLRLKNYKFATRSLMDATFPRSVLATSSISGRPSPAFAHLPAKPQLNPVIIKDIVEEVTRRYGVTPDMISKVMTTKCADEAKISKNKNNVKKRERRNSSEDSEDM